MKLLRISYYKKIYAAFLCRELFYYWLEVNGLPDVIFHAHKCKPVQMMLSHCATKLIFKKISFSLEKERSPVQLVTIMHMNTLSSISTFGNTDFKLLEIIFCTMQGESHNFRYEPCCA